MWDNGKLTINMEITTWCNAKCPQCDRHKNDETDLRKLNPWVNQQHVSLLQFKQMFTEQDLSLIGQFHFSGVYGDPAMNPELLDILYYIRSHDVNVSISTNGGARNPEFWEEAAMLCKDIVFDIDGKDNEQHAKYRRGVKLDRVLRNMKAASEHTRVKVFTVLFKHNEDDLEEIQELARQHGATLLESIESSRFKYGTSFEFINERGEHEVLEQTTKHYSDRHSLSRRVRDHRDEPDVTSKITCPWNTKKTLMVNEKGMVFPCCYIAENFHRVQSKGLIGISGPASRYISNPGSFNLYDNSLDDILNNGFFRDALPNSFDSNPTTTCLVNCGGLK